MAQQQQQQQQQQQAVPSPAPSQTTTETGGSTQPETAPAPRILRLRGRHAPSDRSVQWAEDVVDNEGLGRKSSKGTVYSCRSQSRSLYT